MTDATYQVRAEAEAAGVFDQLDLDRVDNRPADVPLTAIGYGRPAGAMATLAESELDGFAQEPAPPSGHA